MTKETRYPPVDRQDYWRIEHYSAENGLIGDFEFYHGHALCQSIGIGIDPKKIEELGGICRDAQPYNTLKLSKCLAFDVNHAELNTGQWNP